MRSFLSADFLEKAVQVDVRRREEYEVAERMKRRRLGKTSGLEQEINSRLVSAKRKEPS